MGKKEILNKMETISLKLYAIRNKEGKWYRSRGYGGYGNSWVDNISNAKIYAKPGPAKAVVTFWVTNYPSYGVPDLVELVCTESNIINQANRVNTVIQKAKIEKLSSKLRNEEYSLQKSTQKYQNTLDEIKRLKEEIKKDSS